MTNEEFQAHVIETLASLKTHMEGLVGNGQPGRINLIEEKVTVLGKDISRAKGWAAGIGSAALVVWALVKFLFHQ